MKHSPWRTYEVELTTDAEVWRIDRVRKAIEEAGGFILQASDLKRRVIYAATSALTTAICEALDS